MTGCGKCCLTLCLKLILGIGVTTLSIWVTIKLAKLPSCSINYFYIPALNRSINSSTNTTIYLVLKLKNKNENQGVDYDNVNLTLSYAPINSSSSTVANTFIPRFYQGHKKTAKKNANFVPKYLNLTKIRSESISMNKTVIFRVELVTAVRYKIMAWWTKRHSLKVKADVEVNEQGSGKLPKKKKDIELSGSQKIGSYYLFKFGVLLNLLFVFLAYY